VVLFLYSLLWWLMAAPLSSSSSSLSPLPLHLLQQQQKQQQQQQQQQLLLASRDLQIYGFFQRRNGGIYLNLSLFNRSDHQMSAFVLSFSSNK
jgi:hypothetical protein